jgi:hypothetical protein
MTSPRLNDRQLDRDANGLRHACAACGNPETGENPLVISADGMRIHQGHFTDPASGFHGEPFTADLS